MTINLVIEACRCLGIVPSKGRVMDLDGCKLYDILCCINTKQTAERAWKQEGETDECSVLYVMYMTVHLSLNLLFGNKTQVAAAIRAV